MISDFQTGHKKLKLKGVELSVLLDVWVEIEREDIKEVRL